MSTPCNSLNVQLIKVSSLASYSAIKDADVCMIVENTGGSLYSRKSVLSDLRDYVLQNGVSSFPASTYTTQTDSNTLDYYLKNNVSGGIFQYAHGFASIPTIVRPVLTCIDPSGDGSFSQNQEIDIAGVSVSTSPYTLCSIISDSYNVTAAIRGSDTPSTSAVLNTYAYATSPTVVSTYSLTLTKWKLKLYIWK